MTPSNTAIMEMAAPSESAALPQRLTLSDPTIPRFSKTQSIPPIPVSAFSPANLKSNALDTQNNLIGSQSAEIERCEILVSDIRKIINQRTTHFTALALVDSIISLGISHHFHQEIREVLDIVYRTWKQWETEGSISKQNPLSDLSRTALAFKVLRLHRYRDISPDTFMGFREAGEGFYGVQTDSVGGVRKAVNLLRASMVRFPGETVLEEAETFASTLLISWLSQVQDSQAIQSSLIAEVKHWLEYPWYMSPPRWQARRFIDILGSDNQWLALDVNKKMIELAKLDFNITQRIHQQELHHIRKWWDDHEWALSKLTTVRHRWAESYFFVAATIFEPEFADVRLALAKAASLVFLIDDIYDDYGTVDQLQILTDAFRRWDVSVADSLQLPEEMRNVFTFAMRTFREFTEKCNERQKFDTESCIRQRWVGVMESYMRAVEWERGIKQLKGTEEYLRNATESISLWPLFSMADLLLFDMGTCPHKLKELCQISQFYYHCAKTIRLLNDIYGSKVELELEFKSEEEEEAVSTVACMRREKPWLSKEEAVEKIHWMIKQLTEEITRQYLGEEDGFKVHRRVEDRKRVAWELTRVFHFFYRRKAGYELKEQLRLILLDPISNNQNS